MEKVFQLDKSELQEFELVSVQKFILLTVLSLGLYQIWWSYKTWKFFKDKDSLDIIPAARAIFLIIFLYSLFERIQEFSKSKGYSKNFSSIGYFLGFIGLSLSSRLPDPYWTVSFFSMFCFVPAIESLNNGIKASEDYNVIERRKFNYRQIIIIIIGTVLWLLILIGIFLPPN